MKNKKIASLGLAVASLAGVATTTAVVAPSASATTYHRYIHRSAEYTSMAQCQWYLKNDAMYVVKSSKFSRTDGGASYWDCKKYNNVIRTGLTYKWVTYYSFGQLSYMASGPIWPGDKMTN